MKNEIANKINDLPKGEVRAFKTILDIIEADLLTSNNPPYRNDRVEVQLFNGLNFIEIVKLLNKLDKEFGIIDFQRRKGADRNRAVDIGLKTQHDKNNFVEFKKSIDSIDTNKEMIKKLTFVEPDNHQFKVIINDDYLHPVTGDKGIKYWELFSELAIVKSAEKIKYEDQYKHIVDIKKWPFKDDFDYTKLIKLQNDLIITNIEFENISMKQFNARLNGQILK